MFARLSTYQGSPVPSGGDLSRNSAAVVKEIQGVPGFRGVYYLVDRASGRARSLTLWEDEQAMLASEEQGAKIREEVAQREGQRIISVERFEVGFSHLES
ncbi:hypothetical protein [Streptomyces sp. ISL-94]|uniref:hypothetical protein n=1 Tax=Streptomyces sp. ISL-94 TaxID=2819190 RepID=UPI001BE9C6E4|nr:hypothetical protein [Streptomyces sp. ISL-94]MBT2482438.1 hypothetical protein [Streptomyces sp. ISL-94]